MKLGHDLGVLIVIGGVLVLASYGCGNSKASAPDAAVDAAQAAGGTASGGGSAVGGAAAGGSMDGGGSSTVGVGGRGGAIGVGGQGGAGGAVDSGAGAPDGGGDSATAGRVDLGTDAARRYACGRETCVVGESYCRSTRGGVGGAPGVDGGGLSGAGGGSGGPPGSCFAFPADCTTRLDCTCLCGGPNCSLPTSQCTSTDGEVIYTLFNP
jgi:hypothetical protein